MTTTPSEPVSDDDIETVGGPAAQSQMGLGDADAGDADAGDSDAGDGSSRDGAEGGPLDTQDESDSDGSDA